MTSILPKTAEMACANPFGARRLQLERELGGADRRASRDDIFARSFARTEQAIRALKKSALLRMSGNERRAAELSIFYVLFHRSVAEIDKHIALQEKSQTMLRPAFVPALLGALAEYGLAEQGAAERIALAFQLRRAFVFIDSSVTGESRPTQSVREALWNNIFTYDLQLYAETLKRRMEDFSTILLGQTGTGKGAAARAIGMAGYIPWDEKSGMFRENFASTFVALNLSEYSASLIESELFGHEKGAFTGAIQKRAGAFERCSAHGSVFLDEIGDLDPEIQVKLLRVLESRHYTPVGGAETRRFSGRTIAATHRSIESLRSEGRMRHDFYYRLCSDVIRLPSLRERLDADPRELSLLVERIAYRILGEASPGVATDTLRVIAKDLPENYPWPGNVRELEQCVRSVLLTRAYKGDPLALTQEPASGNEKDARAARARMLYRESHNYGTVARKMGIDRRTVKKYVTALGKP
jgi:DNA-binding NtrC family response regulator